MDERVCPRPGCGKPLLGRGPRAIYCSQFCSRKASCDRFVARNPEYHSEWAKAHLAAKKAHSDRWAEKNPGARTQMWKAWKKADPERYRVYNNEKSRRRRARKLGADSEPVDVSILRARQSGLCSLCLEPMDPSVRFPDWEAETVEHEVPLSRGGAHSYANCSLAHWRCNHAKRARTPEEYLAALAGA